MATEHAGGMSHLTVVPENFDPEERRQSVADEDDRES